MSSVRNLYQSQYGIVPQYIADEVNMEASFLGLGKKARARRQERRAARRQFRLDKIAAKGAARSQVAAAGGGLGGIAKGLGGVLSTVFGKGDSGGDTYEENSTSPLPEPEKKSNTGLFIGIGAAVVVVVVVLVVVMKKKKG